MAVHPASITVNASLESALPQVDLADLAAVRHILRGDSVIDWNRTWFRTTADVDRFLALHLLDMGNPDDRRRLAFVYSEAVNYLQEHLDLTFPADLRDPADVRQIFLHAGQTGGFRRRQILSCVILKLMHVINHLEAAELRFQTPLSEAIVLDLAEKRIVTAADRMRSMGPPLVAFYGSRKTRNSVITKLIAKKENTAATIFDKLRFRIVTEQPEDVVPAISWLTRNLFPFNYVIPGQSHNNLVHFREVLRQASVAALGPEVAELDEEEGGGEVNPFSGRSYRMVNFIVDLPVRVDHLMNVRHGPMLGRTVFAMVEFQVLDRETAQCNEEGENAHNLYKERQRAIVEKRLKRGGRWRSRSTG